jgi:signal transduction histidine kinase
VERNITLEAQLIDDLLDLTKIAHGKLHFHPQTCDAHRLIELAMEIVDEDARMKAITIERRFSAGPVECWSIPPGSSRSCGIC